MENKNVFFELQDVWDFLKQHPFTIANPGIHGSAQACFDTKNLEKLKEIKANVILADELNKLQEWHNHGRGISCVRQIVSEISRGDHAGAQAIASTDWDKIAFYPDVAEWLKSRAYAAPDSYVHE